MSDTPSTATVYFNQFKQIFGDFVVGFNEAYNAAYQDAIARGESPLKASIEANLSGMRANASYAKINAERYAASSDNALAQIFKNLETDYGALADDFQARAVASEADLAGFMHEMEQRSASDLGRMLSSPVGKFLRKNAGPASDIYSLLKGLEETLRTGNPNPLGAAGSSVATAALFGLGAGILLTASTPFLAAAIIGGLAVVAGGWAGEQLWDIYSDKLNDWIYTYFLEAKNLPPPRRDPFTLDLDGDGIETITASAGIAFDHNGDGIAVGTGWVNSDDGFLVLDRNGNGTIDSGGELFGADTVLPNGQKASSGFKAVADLDSNSDGVFDADDAEFTNVRVWRDLNQDGISQASELFTLDQLNIRGINLTPSSVLDVDLGNGNVIDNSGTYVRTDGSTGQAGDLQLGSNTFYSNFLTPPQSISDHLATSAEVAMLPNIHGTGMVRDLREAAMQSPGLASLLATLSSDMSRDEMMAAVYQVVEQWANTSTMQTSAQVWESHTLLSKLIFTIGAHDTYNPIVNYMIAVLERFNGTTFVPFASPDSAEIITPSGGTTGGTAGQSSGDGYTYSENNLLVRISEKAAELITQSFNALIESVYGDLAMQTRLHHYYDDVSLSFDENGSVSWFYSELNADISQKVASGNGLNALDDLFDLKKYGGQVFSDWDSKAQLSHMIVAVNYDASFLQHAASLYGVNNVAAGSGAVSGTDVSDFLLGLDNNDEINGGRGNDTLYGGIGNDTLKGGSGIDVLEGGDGDDVLVDGEDFLGDTLRGGAGNDTLTSVNGGFYGNTVTMEGGTGNDTLNGSRNSETYLFGLGDGQDVITEVGGPDVFQFGVGIAAADVAVSRVGNDLILSMPSDTDEITIKNWFVSTSNWIESFVFADGTTWTAQEVTYDRALAATNGNDTVSTVSGSTLTYHALSGNDTITGGSGNDQLYGDEGNDLLSGGNGNDQLFGGADNDTLNAGSGTDVLEGGDGDDVLSAADEDLFGDILRGGAGNDTLINTAGGWNGTTTTLDGGTGDDMIYGGRNNDTYLFNLGDGRDTVIESGSTDVYRFGAGITAADVAVSRVGNDLVLNLTNGTDGITIKNWFVSTTNWIESFVFADGTTWAAQTLTYDRVLAATEGNDAVSAISGTTLVYHALGGNDVLTGGTGNDQLYGDEGDDTLSGGYGNDQLFGGAGNDILNANDGVDVLEGGDGDDTLRGGDDLSGDILRGGAGNDTLIATGGGWNGTTNTMDGGTGDDTIYGGRNNDTYLFNLGDGRDTVIETGNTDIYRFGAGIVAADVAVSRVGNDLVLDLANGTDGITIKNWFVSTANWIESFVFADGAIWAAEYVTQQVALIGTPADDVLTAVAGSNAVIRGGDGNDKIDGNTGNDTLFGDAGNDTITGGSGSDQLYGDDGDDTLSGNAGNDTLFGGAGNDTLNAGSGTDVLEGGDGDDVLRATDEDLSGDTLRGGAGNDTLINTAGGYNGTTTTLEGGTGNDTIFGGRNSDTYLFGLGDGQDVITEIGGPDTFQFGAGITAADVAVSRVGNDLVLSLANGTDSVTVKNWFVSTTNWIESFVFADGTTWTAQEVTYSRVLMPTEGDDALSVVSGSAATLHGLGGNDTLVGATLNDVFYGDEGDDTLDGGSGNDQLYGGVGNDALKGGSGIDVLEGGDGNDVLVDGTDLYGDTLRGGAGNDTLTSINGGFYGNTVTMEGGTGNDTLNGSRNSEIYLFGLGDGQDVITEIGGPDTFQFGAGITAADVAVSRVGNDLVLSLANGTDGVTVKNWFVSTANWIESFVFADGTTWTAQEVTYDRVLAATEGNDTVSAVSGSTLVYHALSGNDTITGNSGSDQLYGDDGDDTLNGGAGADILVGGLGNDLYIVDAASDIVTENAGEGTDTIQSSITYTLGANVENLILTGTAAISGTGNALDNVLIGNAAANTLTGGSGNDTLDGGAGSDKLLGGAGNDSYVIDNTGDVITENINEGIDSVQSSVTYTLSANVENLTLKGMAAINGSGNALDNVLVGNNAANTLTGGAGNDVLSGGLGNDSLNGGDGDDTYLFERTGGQDVINNNDANGAGFDVLRLDATVDYDQLWFQHVGNDLLISIIGTSDTIKVANWYTGMANQLDQIETASGNVLTANEIEALVSAMASFSPPAMGQMDLDSSYASLMPVIAANWTN